jgi:hypothetical protein
MSGHESILYAREGEVCDITVEDNSTGIFERVRERESSRAEEAAFRYWKVGFGGSEMSTMRGAPSYVLQCTR